MFWARQDGALTLGWDPKQPCRHFNLSGNRQWFLTAQSRQMLGVPNKLKAFLIMTTNSADDIDNKWYNTLIAIP